MTSFPDHSAETVSSSVPRGSRYNKGYTLGYYDGLDCNQDNFSSGMDDECQKGYWVGNKSGRIDGSC